MKFQTITILLQLVTKKYTLPDVYLLNQRNDQVRLQCTACIAFSTLQSLTFRPMIDRDARLSIVR